MDAPCDRGAVVCSMRVSFNQCVFHVACHQSPPPAIILPFAQSCLAESMTAPCAVFCSLTRILSINGFSPKLRVRIPAARSTGLRGAVLFD